MTKIITILSLILFITAYVFAQQKNIEHHRLAIDGTKIIPIDAKYEQFLKKHHAVSYKKHLKSSFNSLKGVATNKQTLDSLIFYEWNDNTGQWTNPEKDEFTYDANGNLTSEIDYNWDASTSQWANSYKYENTYDANGNLTSEIDYNWDASTSQWKNSYKYEYTYDTNGNQTLQIVYVWDIGTSQWINNIKREYYNDTNENLTTVIFYTWDASISQWKNSWKSEYTYDANGNETSEISYQWDASTSQWINNRKREYSNDANGNFTSEIYYNWDASTSQWTNYEKYEYTYDANGNPTSEIYFYWEASTSQWTNNLKYETSYDINGNPTLESFYEWNASTSQWKNFGKSEYTYDLLINISDLIVPSWYNDDFFNNDWVSLTNKLSEFSSYTWDETTTDWVKLYKGTLYYSEDNVGVNELSNNDLVVLYPNPVNNSLNVNFTSNSGNAYFELFDIQGMKLISQKVSAKEQINLKHLNSGLYLYTITIGGKKKNGKLIKR